MSVVSTVDVTIEDPTIGSRAAWLATNITVEVLSPLYPGQTITQDDVTAILDDLDNEADESWWIANFPGLISNVITNWQDGPYLRSQSVKTFVDMDALNNAMARYPLLPNYDEYHLDGINLIQNSDGTTAATLVPKEYERWSW